MSDTIQPSKWTPGEIHGTRICRRVIFREAMARQGWPNRMLLAMNTAKALGITMFEIACEGEPPLPSANEGQSNGWLSFGSITFNVDGEEWKSAPVTQSPTPAKKESMVTVYAVVVE